MKLLIRNAVPVLLATAALTGVFMSTPSEEASASAVDGLLGSWRGGGTARYTSGTERLSCNAYYTGGGSSLGLAIRCTSPTSKVEIRSKLRVSGNRVSGTWEERTFNAAGSAAGSANPGRLSVRISGTVNGSMTVNYTKTRQNVSISTTGTSLRGVSVSLTRSG
ncbi:hypothetical protein [Methyloceanibacter sp.]|uniref:hypothetical protein n=1 Tax=Methyloceanibacter sp. TaxID=1965321 RepID=UPI00208305C0|nr:hypothetical protein [Methyloceanibacter sp.]GFO83358.1 MAG: hypothetical protein A49_29850 [Methyloceanibacter sp.]HML92775.1 hypothetical protein [Methyloceanibacter sp.]